MASTPRCLPCSHPSSLFARQSIKHHIARMVPIGAGAIFYVWTASLLLLVVLACWQPIAGEAYRVTGWRAVARRGAGRGPLADCPIGRDNRPARAGRHQADIWTRRTANRRPVDGCGTRFTWGGCSRYSARRTDGRSAHVWCHRRLFVRRDSVGGAIAPADVRRAIRPVSATVRWRIIPRLMISPLWRRRTDTTCTRATHRSRKALRGSKWSFEASGRWGFRVIGRKIRRPCAAIPIRFLHFASPRSDRGPTVA
jgi:hypothetical protein